MLDERTYVDINNTFYKDKDIVTNDSYKAIANSIDNIIFTTKGEKVGDPLFGTNIKRLLFSPMDRITEQLLRSDILDAVKMYEPRAIIDDVIIIPYYDENLYQIQILYRLIKSPNIQDAYVSILKRL